MDFLVARGFESLFEVDKVGNAVRQLRLEFHEHVDVTVAVKVTGLHDRRALDS